MRKSILLAFVCVLMQSCNSNEKDLAQITFTEKRDIFFGDIPHKYELSVSGKTYSGYYASESDDILNFNGIDLSGYRDKKGEFGANYVSFEFSKKDRTLSYYYVTLFYNKNIKKLIEAINSKIDKPSYVPSPLEGDTYQMLFCGKTKQVFIHYLELPKIKLILSFLKKPI